MLGCDLKMSAQLLWNQSFKRKEKKGTCKTFRRAFSVEEQYTIG